MSDKTDAEFIAEYEAAPLGAVAFYEGTPVILSGGMAEMLSEAVERLKRASRPHITLKQMEDHNKCVQELKEQDKQIAELKALLRWCRDEIVSDFGETKAADWGDPQWERITEILKDA